MTTQLFYPTFSITPKITSRLEAIGILIGYLQAARYHLQYRS